MERQVTAGCIRSLRRSDLYRTLIRQDYRSIPRYVASRARITCFQERRRRHEIWTVFGNPCRQRTQSQPGGTSLLWQNLDDLSLPRVVDRSVYARPPSSERALLFRVHGFIPPGEARNMAVHRHGSINDSPVRSHTA